MALDCGCSRVYPDFVQQMEQADLLDAIVDVRSRRFLRSVRHPRLILRSGWRLAPELELHQKELRSYVLGDAPEAVSYPVGQRLVLDWRQRAATLLTYCGEDVQEIRLDLDSLEVTDNQIRTAVRSREAVR
ncbi:MAG: hypothetical protein HY319_16725 [Armatimonadetes bacterium]|nr:hypothetical protein [Armatimonadota bacterium]